MLNFLIFHVFELSTITTKGEAIKLYFRTRKYFELNKRAVIALYNLHS
jgi:hypothetical protein